MSFHETIAPPAHVREAESLLETARTINNAITQGLAASQAGIDSFREAGNKLLKVKTKLEHGKWQEWLAKNIQCQKRQAQKYMRLAREWDKAKAHSNSLLSLDDTLKLLVEDAPEEEESAAPPPPPKQLFCPDCQRKGPMKNCPKCEKLRAKAARTKPPGREPGDDTTAIAAAKKAEEEAKKRNGQVAFDKKQFGSEFGALLREIDRVGNAYKIKETPEAEALRIKLDDWRKEFLKWIDAAVKKAKEAK